jgi:hypothetical protein
MEQPVNYRNRAGGSESGQNKESGEISTAAKAFRAVTAIVVFGIPLVAGAATLLSCGVRAVYKRIKGVHN